MFVVQRGIVDVQLYTDDNRLFRDVRLDPGDAIVLVHGSPRHPAWSRTSRRCRVKQGPFFGDEVDKVVVEPSVIPVFEPDIGDEEVEAVADAIRRGEISGSFGTRSESFEREFADYVGARHGVAVDERHDRAASRRRGARISSPGRRDPRERDARTSRPRSPRTTTAPSRCRSTPSRSPGISTSTSSRRSSRRRTRAIIPVHLFGHPVDMDALCEIAARHGLAVIEDCAESHGATVRGRMTGSLGDMGCFCFYANKIITTGEGGMVTTNDDELAERLRLLRNLAFGSRASSTRRPASTSG